MKYIFYITTFILSLSVGHSQTADSLETEKLVVDIGGALRYNYNLSSWKENQVKRGGDFGFEVFRVDVDAKYKNWELRIDQRFYAADFGGAFLKYGWMQYNIDDAQNFKIGLIPAYFGTQQFNSHSWFFQLPFYLGYEDDHDMGISYSFNNNRHDFDIGYYKNSEELSFSDNGSISDARYAYDISGSNKEVNQINIRYNYKLGAIVKQKIGASLQYGGIWNIDTQSMGSHSAISLHYEMDYKGLNIKAQYLNYDNAPANLPNESTDYIQMTAYGAPYSAAAKASIYSIGIAYSWEVNLGVLTGIQLYNDYSYMDKSVEAWEDTQMNVLGIFNGLTHSARVM